MFEALTEKITAVFNRLGNKGRLTEKDVDEALREVRLALLEADVNLKVVKSFITRIRERSVNTKVLESLTSAQQMIKIVNEEMISILGGERKPLVSPPHPPGKIMLVGLQGSGKTTTAAKLALHLRRSGQRSLLVAADTRRPAAIEQLIVLGRQLDIPVYYQDANSSPLKIVESALDKARDLGVNWIIVDTQGRLHIDEALMDELRQIKSVLMPSEALLVVDAMTGQEAVKVAEEFNKNIQLSGLILTKMDGDARGGAALSIKFVTGVPVKFIGIGEKLDALEPFYPDRLASRILGMGDMLTLIEKAERELDQKKIKELEKKLRTATFDLDDFLGQLRQIKKMGPLSQLVDMIPGFSGMAKKMPVAVDDNKLKLIEAIILSMTPAERHHPNMIDGSRRRRIARGSGTTPQDINRLLNEFRQMQKLLKQFESGKGKGMLPFMR